MEIIPLTHILPAYRHYSTPAARHLLIGSYAQCAAGCLLLPQKSRDHSTQPVVAISCHAHQDGHLPGLQQLNPTRSVEMENTRSMEKESTRNEELAYCGTISVQHCAKKMGMDRLAEGKAESKAHKLFSLRTIIEMGIIMAAAAVLDIHMDKKAVTSISPSTKINGLSPMRFKIS